MAHSSPAQAMAPWDLVGNNPDLEHRPGEGPAPSSGTVGNPEHPKPPEQGSAFSPPDPLPRAPRPGPGAPRTLGTRCWTRAPSWSPAGSWASPPGDTTGSLEREGSGVLGPTSGSGHRDRGGCPHTSWGSCRPRKRSRGRSQLYPRHTGLHLNLITVPLCWAGIARLSLRMRNGGQGIP